ncbi:putative Ig domain-containing protein, partial [Persicitalea sp.]|uniref:putative Ig domain-containing protein n=1 Tax=Persicitalea sp. TaxID=3100273 RepID=UPI0035934016
KLTVAPKEGVNKPPVVSRAIPDQQGQVGQAFAYEISKGTFTDPDGSIAGITAKGLPDGVKLEGWKLAGIPTTSGAYGVTVTARDDKGAEVSAQFKFEVAPKEVPNQSPVVSRSIPNQRGKVGQFFDYEILKETFTDPDGTIAGISAKGLPSGVSLNGWKLAGTPTVTGEYGVTVTARDDKGAEVSTQFKISVDATPTDNVFSLFQAGNFLTRRFLHYIVDGDTLRGDDAKLIVNILVSPKAGSVGSYAFKMEGPYSVGSTDNQTPYGVFGDNGGVVFAAGTYTLNVKSYEKADLKGARLSDETIHFVVVDDIENQNLVPVLVKPPVELFARVGTPFAHRLPDSTFVDPDGIITALVITALPDGLKGDGTLITGTPTKQGVFTAKVRVTDNGNGAAETTFKFTVSADNLPPVANGKIPDQTTEVYQRFSYTIPEKVFTDPDGTISSVTIQGLPEGMINSGRTMSGIPTKVGKYQLVVVAKDNAGAIAQLTFSLTVLDGNRPPLVAKAISDQVADSNAVYRFVIPAGTFIDLDGKIARLEISGLPPQLVVNGDTISGRLTQVGEYAVVVKAFDDKEASAQLTFRLTVRSNQTPLVVRAIDDQVADSNAVYRFIIPSGTFIDTDGKIVRLEISGLPPGLSAKSDTISGRATKVGEFSVTVRAFDDKGASAQVSFKLAVRGGNMPPVADPVPDLIAIVGQIFRFDVKQYFKDSDGAIASISYASALPPGITANGSLLAGNPAAAGDYPVKAVAKDDKGASVTVEFTIRVQRPELHVILYESGQQPKRLREIANADIIPLSTLPTSIDLFVESNANVNSMTFELTGPTSKTSTDEAAPFGLYGNGTGFEPQVGTYKLKVTAYRNNTMVTSRSIQFDIIKANNVPVRLGVEEHEVFPTTEPWKAYPNPFVNNVKVQMSEGIIAKTVEVLSVEGRSTLLDHSKWRMERSLLEVNLTEEAARPGIYLLRITAQGGEARTLRIMKAVGK